MRSSRRETSSIKQDGVISQRHVSLLTTWRIFVKLLAASTLASFRMAHHAGQPVVVRIVVGAGLTPPHHLAKSRGVRVHSARGKRVSVNTERPAV